MHLAYDLVKVRILILAYLWYKVCCSSLDNEKIILRWELEKKMDEQVFQKENWLTSVLSVLHNQATHGVLQVKELQTISSIFL